MGRKRKKNRHLPPRVYQRGAQLYYVHPNTEKWELLPEGLKTWSKMIEAATGPAASMESLWAAYDIDVLSKAVVKPKTAQNRRQEWGALVKTFGAMSPDEIEPHDVFNYWKKRGATSQAKHEVRCLSALLTYARQTGAIAHENPCYGLKLKDSKPRDRYVTDDEFLYVRDLAPPMVGHAMDLALITGMSQIDILKLERKQLLSDGILFDRSKTTKGQLIEWNDELRAITNALIRTPPQLRRTLICTREGKPYSSYGFQTAWQRLMEKAVGGSTPKSGVALERFTFHDIRAKSLSDAKSLEEAQKRGGHSDSKLTQRVYRRLPVRAKALSILDK